MLKNVVKGWRNDGIAKVTGKAKYADDLNFADMLHAVPVYTDYVHAKILKINIDAALKSSGVHRVIIADDIPGKIQYGQIQQDYFMLAKDFILGNGDVIALVVADTRENALCAAKKVGCEVAELPVISDPEQAMLPGARFIHPGKKTNIVCHHQIRRGDISAGKSESNLLIETIYETQRIEHAYMEPEGAVCVPRDDGIFEIYASLQHPFTTRRFTAAILGVPLSRVEVRGIPMGGGFGGKDDTASIVSARAALCAKLTGKPVKIIYDREWSFRESYKRHPYKMDYKIGFSESGKIKFTDCRFVADAGNYCSVSPFVLWRSTVQCCGPYQVDHVKCDAIAAHTNNVFTGAMRGFGSPQVNFAIESIMDEAAYKLKMTPIEIRKLNMVKQGDETITGQILSGHKVSLGDVLDKAVEATNFENKYKKSSFGKSESDELYGIGLAMSYRGMSLGAEGKDFCSAIINVQFDGSVLLEVGIHENGQGAETAMVKILAEALDIPIHRIQYRRLSTSSIPDGGPTVASRGTLMGGGAVTNAAKNLKILFAETLSESLQCKKEDIEFKDDGILAGKKHIPFNEMVNMMFNKQTYPFAFGLFQAPQVDWDEETGKGNAYFTWVYGCQVVELSVNKNSGKVKLLNAVAVHDVGKTIDEQLLLGQYYGGMAMGIGYALKEEVQVQEGKISNPNFNKYQLVRAKDMPEMQGIIVENRDPLSPSGAKGIGEPTNELMAPAIANAIFSATGKRYRKLPIKVEPLV